MAKIISGFPGIGKSTLKENGYDCIDADSSKFDKAQFPGNFIEFIKRMTARQDIEFVFIPTHESVRKLLLGNDIDFTVVYPDRSLKEEYLTRYKERGSPTAFIDIMFRQWDSFIQTCEDCTATKVMLSEGEYLQDVLDQLV